jgi:hypothetical protein
MKITNQIETTPGVATKRALNWRTAVRLLAVSVAGCTLLAAIAFAQSAKEIRGATPYAAIENEPEPKLIVDPPLPDLLAHGVVWIQYRAENVHIVPVFGKGALSVSPRSGTCTFTWMTCPGGGRTQAITILSIWPECRLARIRS